MLNINPISTGINQDSPIFESGKEAVIFLDIFIILFGIKLFFGKLFIKSSNEKQNANDTVVEKTCFL